MVFSKIFSNFMCITKNGVIWLSAFLLRKILANKLAFIAFF